jgi:hypothetical protein
VTTQVNFQNLNINELKRTGKAFSNISEVSNLYKFICFIYMLGICTVILVVYYYDNKIKITLTIIYTVVNIYFFVKKKLFIDERITSRADNISKRMQNEFSFNSPEYITWTNKTATYNSTSLQQVIGEYFNEFSVGDIGNAGSNYSPRPGYPGTLAPGEHFNEEFALDTLPKEILHPWPAMQEFQVHVRWPPNHPMIPPPLLWFGLNNMFTQVC